MIKEFLLGSRLTPIFLIVTICFLTNWMLLINDGFFWDDNLIYVLFETKNYNELHAWSLEMGLPLNYFYLIINDYLFGFNNHRLISFISIVISSALVHDIFRHYSRMSIFAGFAFVSLYISLYPFKTTVLLSTLQYQLSLFFFLLAVFLRLNYSLNNNSFVRLLVQIIFIILSLVSFATASILVLYCFYMMFDYFHSAEYKSRAFTFSHAYIYAQKNLLLMLLPFIYWLVKSVFFPVHGLYSGYNSINLDLNQLIHVFKSFFESFFVYGLFYNLWVNSPRSIFLISLTFVLLSIILGRNSYGSVGRISKGCKYSCCIFGSSVFILITALPYMLVNAAPSFGGWNSRHYILWTVSAPVFVFAVLYIYVDKLKEMSGAVSLNFIFYSSIICIVVAGIFSSNYVYLDYQVQAIKQHAVVENLKKRPDLKIYSVFWIDDRIGSFNGSHLANTLPYQAWYEWAAIFRKAWGAEKWYGNNINMNEERIVSARYGASLINPDGLRCTLILSNKSTYGRSGVVRRYLKYKYFGTEGQLNDFLLSIVSLEGCD